VLAGGTAVLNLLGWQHHALAWAGCRLISRPPEPLGWGVQLVLAIEQVQIGPDGQPLVHHRGRYHRI
jgi:flavin reductase (DIM6/NTAB) family NADH-FMN oxidoreductase RutF